MKQPSSPDTFVQGMSNAASSDSPNQPAAASTSPAKFGAPPLLSSLDLRWDGLALEYFEVPAAESGTFSTSEVVLYVQQDQPAEMHIHEGKETIAHRVTPDEICITPQGWSGSIALSEPSKYLSVRLSPELMARAVDENVRARHIEIIQRRGVKDPALLNICAGLRHEVEAAGETGRLYSDALSVALAARLLRLYSATPFLPKPYSRGLPKHTLQRVIDYIEANLQSNLPLADLAALASMSPYYFARLFRDSMGLPPHQYLIRRRVERAKGLLADSARPLADIAREVGYENQSNFAAVFRRITGVTPKTFRSSL
jgi:AraC family transcriptional regulator